MTAPRVAIYDDAPKFASAVAAPLAERAIVNNVFLSVLERMTGAPERDHLRAAAWDGDALLLAALMTPPYSLNLAHAGRGLDGIEALADALAARGQQLPGAGGEVAIAEAFAAAWVRRTGSCAGGTDRRLLYRAQAVMLPANVAGALKPAVRGDLARHIAWESAFTADVDTPVAQREQGLINRRVEGWLAKGALFDWMVGGRPAAHGVVLPIGPDGARVLAIYTPPEERNHGYAQAMTAALTQRAFDQGRWCTLFTDAGNPITNKIYQRIGYRLVTTFGDVPFTA